MEPIMSAGEKGSEEPKQSNADSITNCVKVAEEMACSITSEIGEHTVAESQSGNTENNCEISEAIIRKSVDVSATVEGNSMNVTSQNKNIGTELQPEILGDSCEVNKADGVTCDINEPVYRNVETINNDNQSGTDDISIIDAVSTSKSESQKDSVDVPVVMRMHSDVTYQKNTNSLLQLCGYGSDSESEENSETQTEKTVELVLENRIEGTSDALTLPVSITAGGDSMSITQDNYRKPVEVISDTDSEEESSEEDESSSSSETTSSSDDSDEVIVHRKGPPKRKTDANCKTKGEMGLEDLPPIEDLHITVQDSECVEIGHVMSIVDSLVVVQALKDSPALDLESVLFLDKGKRTLGQVFDVFGPVVEPCYCVRFNSSEHAKEKGIENGMAVYFAPRTKHVNFVFVSDLMKVKGSDASWEHNNEPPEKFIEYSDDEEERQARKSNKAEFKKEKEPDSEPCQRPKKRPFRRNQQGYQQQQEGQHFANQFQGNPWASENVGGTFAPPEPPPSPFQHGPQPLVRPPTFNNPPPFLSSNNIDTQSPRINPWAVSLPAQNYSFSQPQQSFSPLQQSFSPHQRPFSPHQQSFSPHQQSFSPSPMGGYPQQPPNFTPPDANFAPPNLNFSSPNANFISPNSNFQPPQFDPFGPAW